MPLMKVPLFKRWIEKGSRAARRAVLASALDLVSHPDVGLDVEAAAVLEVHRDERARHDVVAVVREGHARPLLPLRARAHDRHRAWGAGEHLSAEPLVRSQP